MGKSRKGAIDHDVKPETHINFNNDSDDEDVKVNNLWADEDECVLLLLRC